MSQLVMYPGQANSPATELAAPVDDIQTTIQVVDANILPDAPNIATIGVGENAETILYTEKDNVENTLTVTRGFQGGARAWGAGIKIRRLFTAYDWDSIRQNFKTHEAERASDDVHGLGYSGAHIRTTTVKSIPSETTYTTVPFDVASFQIKGTFWNIDNPTRLVIPNGVSRVKVKASFYFGTGEGRISARLRQNGGGIPFTDCMIVTQKSSGIPCSGILASPAISVSPGDYFELQVSQSTGNSINLDVYNNNTWLNVEVIE